MSVKLLDLDPQKRDAILNAALKEFSSQGYDKASTNIIAKEAGISKPLMFHYVSSKQELFFMVYDYFSDLIKREYFEQMNFDESDIFTKLQCSYLLQLKLTEEYPWILEFHKLSRNTDSEDVNKKLDDRKKQEHANCYPKLFDNIDEHRFRKGLDINTCKQFIYWSNVGFADELLEEVRNNEISHIDYGAVTLKLNNYFAELRKIFYRSNDA